MDEKKILNDIKKLMDELNFMIEDCKSISTDPYDCEMPYLIHNLDTAITYLLRPLMRKLKKEYKEVDY